MADAKKLRAASLRASDARLGGVDARSLMAPAWHVTLLTHLAAHFSKSVRLKSQKAQLKIHQEKEPPITSVLIGDSPYLVLAS